jgi:hypothetical protein
MDYGDFSIVCDVSLFDSCCLAGWMRGSGHTLRQSLRLRKDERVCRDPREEQNVIK